MSKNIDKSVKIMDHPKPAGAMYLMTVVGAAVYFVQNTSGFWHVVVALLKSLVWPAYLVHQVLHLLHV